jgi:hypothetical protein
MMSTVSSTSTKKPLLQTLRGGPFETPFDMLTGCHERIRTFTDVALRIAKEPAPAAQIAEAASRLGLYFGTALPLHEEDEEETLYEAMVAARAPGIDPLFARLRDEHRAIESVLARLLPAWASLARAPELVADVRSSLAEGAEELAAAFAPHLQMEEEELYPLAMRALPAPVLDEMLRAMRARRKPVIGKLHALHAG